MDVKTLAGEMTSLFKSGQGHEVGQRFWADDVVSIEAGGPEGMDPASRGRAAVEAKGKWWVDNHDVSGLAVEGPFINGDQVAFRFEMDITMKATGQAMHMVEVALYTVKDGKITEEKFLYGG